MLTIKNGSFLAAFLALAPLGASACVGGLEAPTDEPMASVAAPASVEVECGQQPAKWLAFEAWDGHTGFADTVRRGVLIVEHHTVGIDGKAPDRITIYGVDTDNKQLAFAMDAPVDAQAYAIAGLTRGALSSENAGENAEKILDRANHIITLDTSAPGPPGPRSPGFPSYVRGDAIVQLAMQASKLKLDLDPVCPVIE
jgi:hypothetical protein